MRRDIPCPEEGIGGQLVDLVTHLEKDAWRDVTLGEGAVGTSLQLRVLGVAVRVTTAEHVVAFSSTANFVVQVQMDVCELDHAYCVTHFFVFSDFLIEVVDEVISFEIVRLVRQDLLDKILGCDRFVDRVRLTKAHQRAEVVRCEDQLAKIVEETWHEVARKPLTIVIIKVEAADVAEVVRHALHDHLEELCSCPVLPPANVDAAKRASTRPQDVQRIDVIVTFVVIIKSFPSHLIIIISSTTLIGCFVTITVFLVIILLINVIFESCSPPV